MTGVELSELALTPRSLALGRTLRLTLPLLGPVAQAARGYPLRLQRVDATQEPCQEPRRVAADLVPSQRKLVEPVEQHRQPVRGTDGGEERIQPRLQRVLPEQALCDHLIGRDPELLIGQLDQRPGALPQASGGRSGTREHHDLCGSRPRGDEPGEPGGERLAAPGARASNHQQGARDHARRPRRLGRS